MSENTDNNITVRDMLGEIFSVGQSQGDQNKSYQYIDMQMTVSEILEEYFERHEDEYDGLCTDDPDYCGCSADNLAPCIVQPGDGIPLDCLAAHGELSPDGIVFPCYVPGPKPETQDNNR